MRGYKRPEKANEFTKIMNHVNGDTPTWFIEGILFGLECCRFDYDPANEKQSWNDDYFIDDRYPTSLIGGIKEAWLYLYLFDVHTIEPCLTQFEQSNMALDYYRNGIPGQVKSGCVIRDRGAIEFDRSWLTTAAKELAVFVRGRPIVLVGSITDWHSVVNAALEEAAVDDPDHYGRNPDRKVVIGDYLYGHVLTTYTLPSHIQG